MPRREHVIPVTMELGGKSPNVVFADADLERTIPAVVNAHPAERGPDVLGRLAAAGAGTRPRAVVDLVRERFAATTIGAPVDDPDLGPLISAVQRDRVLAFTGWAREHATVAVRRRMRSTAADSATASSSSPPSSTTWTPTSPLAQEEVFGPVLAVTPFHTSTRRSNWPTAPSTA